MSIFPKNLARGAWIFVSHSNLDFEQVRKIRNYLEGKGHKPILFYLKAQENESWKKVFEDFIKDEIRSREVFVICQSPNAKVSDPVQDEIDFVLKLKGVAQISVDLEWPWAQQQEALNRASRSGSVFVSYLASRQQEALPICDGLENHGFRVWSLLDVPPSANWRDKMTEALAEAHVVALLDPQTVNSPHVQAELKFALDQIKLNPKLSLFPVVISDFQATFAAVQATMPDLAHYQLLDFSVGSAPANIQMLAKAIRGRF